MAELVSRTGVSPATIRHYLSIGLIPAPQRAAPNRFLYDRRHEQALHLVRLLRERRQMPLAEIARILPGLAKMPGEQAFRPEMWDEVAQSTARGAIACAPAERLLAAGLTLFTRHGFSEVTVDDLCGTAELAKGSFYLHYRSKEELFFAVVSAAGAEVSRAFAGGASSDGLSEGEASALLGSALTGRLPLFLDLLALAAQRRPGHARVAQSVFAELRTAVRAHLRPPADESAGRRVLGDALVQGIRHTIGVLDSGPRSGA